MNQWMRDSRVQKAEVDAFEAERAERRGDFAAARSLYHQAGEAFASVALGVPADHPNTRGDLAIAAVASLARAGDLGSATEVGRRMLVEADALTELARAELIRLVKAYDSLLAAPIPKSPTPEGRGDAVREEVRRQFQSAA